jgi:uncharacterized protein (DUF3084 family)|tara:strand:+ start:135 stop:377 length:243 start_codon:yes stop_codon:yes gene_type:complete
MQTQEMEYVSPLRKLVRFFESSRDKWKAKHHEVKKQLKLAQNQIRAVEKSRAKWRQDAENASAEADAVRTELKALKNDSA